MSRSITIFKDDCTANCYEIEIVTSKDPKSGTDDKIEIQLEGQNGTFTEWFELDSPSWFYNDFETDLKTTYYAQARFQNKINFVHNFGHLVTLEVNHLYTSILKTSLSLNQQLNWVSSNTSDFEKMVGTIGK